MMKTYALVSSAGAILRRRQFEEGQQTVYPVAKGLRWVLDNGPGANADYKVEDTPIAANATEVAYVFRALPTVKQIHTAKAFAILESKLRGTYTHTDGHAYQLGPEKTGIWGMHNILGKGAEAGVVDAGAPNADVWPANFKFVDAANVDVAMTAAQMLDMAQGASAYVTAVRRRFWDLRKQIADVSAGAGAVAAVLAIDVTAGWP